MWCIIVYSNQLFVGTSYTVISYHDSVMLVFDQLFARIPGNKPFTFLLSRLQVFVIIFYCCRLKKCTWNNVVFVIFYSFRLFKIILKTTFASKCYHNKHKNQGVMYSCTSKGWAQTYLIIVIRYKVYRVSSTQELNWKNSLFTVFHSLIDTFLHKIASLILATAMFTLFSNKIT